jgi:IrrE N-terminal-like domain
MTHTSTPVSSAPLQMADLYQRLAKIGLPKKYLKDNILPDWWSDEVDQTPGVLMEGAMYLSRRLNIDIASLITSETPHFIPAATAKFKTNDSTDLQKISIPCALALSIAETVAHECPQHYQNINLLSISEIRQQILSESSAVNLSGVLNFCWESGIPVIHLNQFPSKVHRFQGMVASFKSRPVIVVSLNDCSLARLLFIIAHELGHILAGHLDNDACRVDPKILLESDSDEENEANQIAAELLLGQSGISYDLWTRKYLSSEALVAQACRVAPINQADPGVIALNIAWNRAHRARTQKDERIAWATGKKALATLEPNANAPMQINEKLAQQLNLFVPSDSLKESEKKDYLSRILGLLPEHSD